MEANIKIFKALSDKTRLRIVKVLVDSGREVCICDLVYILNLAQYNLSRHMKELKNSGLVSEKKLGRFVFYSLTKADDHFNSFIFKAIKAMPLDFFAEDLERMKSRKLCCDLR